jgi:protein TonB
VPAESAFALPAHPPEPRQSAPESSAPAAARAPKAAAQATPPVFNAGYLRNPPPVYPLIARRNGEQGTVTVKVLVARDGRPASVNIERTSGSAHLDRAALDAVKTWRFVPAREGSEPIEAWVLVPIVFRLEGAS